jgi:hypothetical protein
MTHQVRDGSRLLQFEGEVLGSISSQREDPRWTEITLYRTVGGFYVLEKVGRSVVTHMPGCPEIRGEIPRFQAAHPGDDPDFGYEFHRCVPDEYDFTELLVEEDRYWAFQTREPAEVVEALYRKRQGSRHLPRIGIDLLEQVTRTDPMFGSAWMTEHIA